MTGGDLPRVGQRRRGRPGGRPDADDFVLSLDPGGPSGTCRRSSEIFPDRFASSGSGSSRRRGRSARLGQAADRPRARDACEWFGGDLRGSSSGSTTSAAGSERYLPDPGLPGRQHASLRRLVVRHGRPAARRRRGARSLARAASGRGIRLVGDLTTNHCGAGHPWFRAALAEPPRPSARSFTSTTTLPSGYESWYGVPSLPKLDWRSPELRERMTAIVRRRLRRARRLAHRRRQHDRPLPRRRPEPRRRPAASGRPAATPCPSPSTATTTGTTSARAAGTAR